MTDARFEDGAHSDRPLLLGAESADDLGVVSSLVQDAVGVTREISWMPRRRRLVMLVNRFRWEDRDAAKREKRPFERVRSALVFDDVLRVKSQGLPPDDAETVYAVLAISFAAGADGAGEINVTLAGDGVLSLEVECVNMQLTDLTRPWETAHAPDHGTD
ncbi:MAG: DUF2948 family protein [Paracoccaceae bacterium]